jgi:hypothetical protein
VTFEEHLQNHRRADGSYDLAATQQARAEELAQSPDDIGRLAAKAAQTERAAWQRKESENLRKLFVQPALSPDLELEIKVPLGDNIVVDYGDMYHKRIQLRKDLRTKVHIEENRTFETEMTHWMHTEQLLEDGQTIGEALAGGAR